MNGLSQWVSAITQDSQLNARKRISKRLLRGKSLLSGEEPTSGSGESAAVHHAQSSLSVFGDKVTMGDNDPAVVNTMGTLAVAGSDASGQRQEKEARSVGGIPSR